MLPVFVKKLTNHVQARSHVITACLIHYRPVLANVLKLREQFPIWPCILIIISISLSHSGLIENQLLVGLTYDILSRGSQRLLFVLLTELPEIIAVIPIGNTRLDNGVVSFH